MFEQEMQAAESLPWKASGGLDDADLEAVSRAHPSVVILSSNDAKLTAGSAQQPQRPGGIERGSTIISYSASALTAKGRRARDGSCNRQRRPA